ncbi:DNA polymerase, partial [Frankia sp. CpI1-P]
PSHPAAGPLADLWSGEFAPRQPLALVVLPKVGFALAHHLPAGPPPLPPSHPTSTPVTLVVSAPEPAEAAELVAEIERRCAPRWVWWSASAAVPPATQVRLAACWDLAAVHRLLHGGRRDDPAAVWAAAAGLPLPPPPSRPPGPAARVAPGQLGLWEGTGDDPAARHRLDPTGAEGISAGGGVDTRGTREPVGAGGPLGAGGAFSAGGGFGLGGADGPLAGDGQLDAGWLHRAAGPGEALRRAAALAALALQAQHRQQAALNGLADRRARPGRTSLAVLTARAESAAELLARELERDGLPIDRATAETLLAEIVGPPPRTDADELAARRRRDAPVLAHLRGPVDLRNPAAVRAALRAVGIDVPDTRSGRLEPLRDAHPAVAALLAWRRTERIATTYGHRWLDTHVAPDGRLRGAWHGSDGAAGRMTAQAGLHNLPADLRAAVVAEPGRVFVRADLGQIEPRVLAVVSADPALAAATQADDMYAPVAAQLGRDRPQAKIAMLAAMYGQTTGSAGEALRRMRRAYPTALAYLDAADAAGRSGRDLRTYGGRLVRLAPTPRPPRGLTDPAPPDEASPAAGGVTEQARGRFARNAVIQGPAAELFKAWAVTVRAELPALGGEIVLCLHDELLLHVPIAHAEAAADLLRRALAATAAYWSTASGVRFVADVSILHRWSDAAH